MRKTKIICTMGPSTDKPGVLEQLVEAGLDVARMNFSHGSHEEHKKRLDRVRAIEKKVGRPVAVLLDTKGPEIRTGCFKEGKVQLKAGQKFTLTSREVEGDEKIVSITYKNLYQDVRVGGRILIDDGLIELRVDEVKGEDIICHVENGGPVSDHKGVNVPDVHLNLPYMSKKDMDDIAFGVQNGIDFIAASFVRSAEDVMRLRWFLEECGGQNVQIMSKIENMEGVNNIDEIIEQSDAIMIARGDMGVELPPEEVPVIQKMIIKKASAAGKQVVTATQMLDSMIKNPRPTRAEAADVANAVFDGTSAIMLSGETAAGAYPVEALKMMVKIAERTEEDINYKQRFYNMDRSNDQDITNAICHATVTTAYDLNAKAIVTVTKSGRSAKMVSKYRPGSMIIAGTTDEKVLRQLKLAWGVIPVLLKEQTDPFELFDHAISEGVEAKYLEKGDLVVSTCGVPLRRSGTTNMLKVQVVE